ncbi:MAG: hypothetical protein M3270_10770 [Thermoproteota archaeon]|nr:hypothetical protein [Thermoproteota archaeon]
MFVAESISLAPAAANYLMLKNSLALWGERDVKEEKKAAHKGKETGKTFVCFKLASSILIA